MRANTDSKSTLPSQCAAALPRAPIAAGLPATSTQQPADAAPHRISGAFGTNNSRSKEAAAVFKKTPCIADLRPTGRDVAKDKGDVSNIPVLMTDQLDHDLLRGDRLTVSSQAIREDFRSETRSLHQLVVRQTRPIHRTGGVGLKGNFAPEGAIVKVAGMSYLPFFELVRHSGDASWIGATVVAPAAVWQGGHSWTGAAGAARFDVNVTDDDGLARTSKRTSGATDHLSDALWNDAQQVRSAVRGAAVGPGGAAEKHCYANV